MSPFPVAPSFGEHNHDLAQQRVPGTVNFGLRHWPSFGLWDFMGGSKDEKKSREDDLYVVNLNPMPYINLFTPTRTLLHTYKRHDDDDDHHHHHQQQQYVDWGNNINFIFMRDEHSPPPMNNMLIWAITSTLSS